MRASPVLWAAAAHRALLDVALGVAGAAAFPGLASLNILDELRLRPDVGMPTVLCGIGFAIASLLPNIVERVLSLCAPRPASHPPRFAATKCALRATWSRTWVLRGRIYSALAYLTRYARDFLLFFFFFFFTPSCLQKVAWLFYFGQAFNTLVNVSSVFLSGVVELLIPALLFLYCARVQAK